MSTEPFLLHAHTNYSNLRLRDSINRVESLLEYALELGLPGLTITDHECLSGHVKASNYIRENKDRFGDFTLAFGDEIYLADRAKVEKAVEENEKIQFHHFILIAKNQHGYEGLKKISSKAWENSFMFRGMERVVTYKDFLEEIMQEYKGDIIATTACVGGELAQLSLRYNEEKTIELKREISNFIGWCKDIFEDDFYIELQPSEISQDQLIANRLLESIGKAFSVPCVVTTDAHYLRKEDLEIQKVYLQASNGEREVEEFYSTTYVMDKAQLSYFFRDDKFLEEMIDNTNEIRSKIQPIHFAKEMQIPHANIPEFKQSQLLVPFFSKYEYFSKFHDSPHLVDQYYFHLISEGLVEKNQALDDRNLSRINTELAEVHKTSVALQQSLSAYFVLTKDIVDIMWEVSLVGVARGSASCYYTNYLLDIVQINPIDYDLPHWRFLTADRPELPKH